MTDNDIQNRLVKLIKDNTKVTDESINSLVDDNSLSSLGINSIEFVKIAVAIETEFDIEFQDNDLDASKFQTIDDIIGYIKSNS